MNLFNKVLAFISILLITFFILIISVRKGYVDEYIKITLENYLSRNGIVTKLTDFHVIDNTLSAKVIDLTFSDNANGRITDFTVIFSFSGIILNPIITLKVNGDLSLVDRDKVKIISSIFSTEHHFRLIDFSLKTQIFLDHINGTNFKEGTALCTIKDSTFKDNKIGCKILFSKESTIEFDSKVTKSSGKISKLNASLIINNVPLEVYKLAERVSPSNDILILLKNYIKSGYISRGTLELNLDEAFFKTDKLLQTSLKGDFDITNLELQYDTDFPSIKNMDGKLSASGSLMSFKVSKAYSSNTLLSNGLIDLEWTGLDTSNIRITATGKGPAVDLTDFITEKPLQNAKKNGIDFRQISGTAYSKISIIIPLNPKIKNSYNISSEVSNANLRIFNNNIDAQKFKISGLFNGNQVILKGTGKINDFDSDIDYQYNLFNKEEYDQLLKIKSKINKENKSLSIIKLNFGNAILNFEYKSKGDISVVSADSNLKNLDFYIDKISIHKPDGDSANLTINGDLNSINNGQITFKLIGANNLKILGKTTLYKDKKEIIFPIISHNNTNVQGKVVLDKNTFSTEIKGVSLDLSKADMIKFLEKDDDMGSILKVNVDKVLLKNDVNLNDVTMSIYCDTVKCHKGYFDSKLGSKFLRMLLKTFKDKEEWVITSNNAGAVFSGLGMYTNMKRGTMLLVLNTSRKEVKKGEVIPILDGVFTFKNFMITDTPFLTRLVSFVSFPGFLNFITDNKNVAFSTMNGNLSYNNSIMKISNASADGPYFDFTLSGTVDTNTHKVKLNGNIIPSLYGVSTILKNIPILGTILSGGRRKGIVFAPYSIEEKY